MFFIDLSYIMIFVDHFVRSLIVCNVELEYDSRFIENRDPYVGFLLDFTLDIS